MEACNLIILSKGKEWQDRRNVVGEVDIGRDTLLLNYSLDGDSCSLKLKNGKVEQYRKGLQSIHIEFKKNEFTKCVIGDDGLCGSYQIFTKNLDFKIYTNGFKIMLEYESGGDKENINLVLTAYIKEKNEN